VFFIIDIKKSFNIEKYGEIFVETKVYVILPYLLVGTESFEVSRSLRELRTLSVNIKFICTSFRNRQNGEFFRPVSQQVQMNFIFNDNVRILCLSCNVKKVGKLVRFKQKG
jgi:hypothetical protein